MGNALDNMKKRKTCKRTCKDSYMKEHIRIRVDGQNMPDNATKKLIYNDCKKRMCNPKCINTIHEKDNITFHPDYSEDEVRHLKNNGALSWCAQRPIAKNPFNVYNIRKSVKHRGKTARKMKQQTKKSKFSKTYKFHK